MTLAKVASITDCRFRARTCSHQHAEPSVVVLVSESIGCRHPHAGSRCWYNIATQILVRDARARERKLGYRLTRKIVSAPGKRESKRERNHRWISLPRTLSPSPPPTCDIPAARLKRETSSRISRKSDSGSEMQSPPRRSGDSERTRSPANMD
jgi:hypothetical protein